MQRNQTFKKNFWQCFMVFIEVVGIAYLITLLSSSARPFIDWFDRIERLSIFIAIYEIFVYVTLTFINDARQDSLLALRTSYEFGLLYCETGVEQFKSEILHKIDKQLESHIFNHPDIRQEYGLLQGYVEVKDKNAIKYKIILISHNYEACNLKWKFSFLLSLFK